MEPQETVRVTGWGYEGRTVADLVEFARAIDAALVVDVRLNAISRKRDFSKARLSERLQEDGIRYLHLPELGNPKDNREAFAAPGSAANLIAHARFAHEVLDSDAGQSAVRLVAGAAERGPVILLCYERDEACCHRAPVIDAVERLVHASLLTR